MTIRPGYETLQGEQIGYSAILDRLREAVRARPDFVVSTHRLDFYGLCARCSQDASLPA